MSETPSSQESSIASQVCSTSTIIQLLNNSNAMKLAEDGSLIGLILALCLLFLVLTSFVKALGKQSAA